MRYTDLAYPTLVSLDSGRDPLMVSSASADIRRISAPAYRTPVERLAAALRYLFTAPPAAPVAKPRPKMQTGRLRFVTGNL